MAEKNRRKIIDRANRVLRQSKALRKMSDKLLQESKDLKAAVSPKRSKRGRT